jgi:hypothetical protein
VMLAVVQFDEHDHLAGGSVLDDVVDPLAG